MSEGSLGGRPSLFCKKTTDKILEAIGDVLVLSQASAMARISRQTLYNWLMEGKKDIEENNLTDKAVFFYDVKMVQAKQIKKIQLNIRNAIPNWQSQAWLLERCFREDFGADAGIVNDLLAKCEQLEAAFKRMEENKGVINNV